MFRKKLRSDSRRQRRGGRRHTSLRAERLEERDLLTTTLYLDFGSGIGFDPTTGERNALVSTTAELRNIAGPGLGGGGTGPDLTSGS